MINVAQGHNTVPPVRHSGSVYWVMLFDIYKSLSLFCLIRNFFMEYHLYELQVQMGTVLTLTIRTDMPD